MYVFMKQFYSTVFIFHVWFTCVYVDIWIWSGVMSLDSKIAWYFHCHTSHRRSVLVVIIHLFFWSVKECQLLKVIFLFPFFSQMISPFLYHIYQVHKFGFEMHNNTYIKKRYKDLILSFIKHSLMVLKVRFGSFHL